MPRLRRPPPAGILNHLTQRFRDGRVSVEDFIELKHWLESEPEVPAGRWYQRFKKFTLAGEGELPKTFLTPGMAPLIKRFIEFPGLSPADPANVLTDPLSTSTFNLELTPPPPIR